ncbi:MAG TPA: hypothetical protein VGO45_10830, partial [Bacteroidia bacterium]|nr:hypothetical protein [Bacteroidia bacterium]
MKWFLPSFLLMIYVAVLMQPLVPLIDYAFNKDYIAKVYCENKARVAMHCNGKCHLMKQMKKASEETPRNHSSRTATTETFLPHYSNTAEIIMMFSFRETDKKI